MSLGVSYHLWYNILLNITCVSTLDCGNTTVWYEGLTLHNINSHLIS